MRKRLVFSANIGEHPPVDKFNTSTIRIATNKQRRGGDAISTDFFSGEMGENIHAFSFKKLFPAPGTITDLPAQVVL